VGIACRAGTTTRFSFGNDLKPDQARIGPGASIPVRVGSFPFSAEEIGFRVVLVFEK